MLKQSVVYLLLTIAFHLCQLTAQISKDDITQAIKIGQIQHPYLLFTNADKPSIIERIKTDKESKLIMSGIMAEAHRYLYFPIEAQAPAEPEHPRYMTDGKAVNYRTEIINGALTLSFLYQITGDIKYAKKAIEFAIAISNLPVWINAAHKFDIIYPRVWPYNVPDDQVVFSYDITAARVARDLAIVYDWLYPVLTKEERDKIRNGLLEKAITRVRGNYEFFWWSTAYRCNWSMLCYSGLGSTALALLKDNPQLVDVVAESYNRMNLTLDQIGDDGGWQEGRGYYSFMLNHSSFFMDMLKRLTDGKYNLFNHPKLHNHPFDFELFGLTANFGDGSGGPIGPTYLVNKLVEETGSNTAAWYRQNILDEGTGMWDILWPRKIMDTVEPKQKSKYFSSIDWVIMRTDFKNPAFVTIACKAGNNNDPHHGHLDCGHFNLTWQNEQFIKDLGGMKYDEYYFNNDRWNYPFASSLGHNVVFVNDEEQICAKTKDQPWKDGIGGQVLNFQTNEKRDYVLMDPTHAYPNKELKRWRRSIILEKPVITVLLDEVESAPGAEIKVRFYTGGTFEEKKNHIIIIGEKGKMALIPLVINGQFKINKGKFPYIPVKEDVQLTWIPYVETLLNASASTSVIATVILPVNNSEEADTVVKSARIIQSDQKHIEVSIETSTGNYKWAFQNNGIGFDLVNENR